jgi:hypothetical protein
MFDFTVENSTNEGDFPKLSTGEFPVFFDPIDLLNRSCPVRPDGYRFTGPIPALPRNILHTLFDMLN